MKHNPGLVRNAGEGELRWFAGGGLFTMKATTDETAGSLSVFEDRVVRGKTTPFHLHPNNDELTYVLDGEIRVRIGDAEHVVRAGGMYFVPRGTPHAFLVISEVAHLLAVQTPGTGEAFYRDVSDPATSEADAARPPDLARLHAGASRSPHIEVLGPPPFGAP
jgi:quercetin dioxygenase-like cupin family protein